MILSVTLNPSVDRILYIDRLSPFDTNRVQKHETDAGGKGVNVARVVSELGCEAVASGFLGGGTGAFVRSVLSREGVRSEFIEIDGDTRLNIAVEDGSGKPPTTFNETGPNISDEDQQALLSRIAELGKSADYVAMGGSLPPGVEQNAFARILSIVGGNKCIVDADGEALRLAIQARPFLVKPNESEAERLLNGRIDSLDEGLAAAGEIRKMGAEIAIVSMGEAGAAMSSPEGDYVGTSPKVKPVSTIGSGDSLIGGFLFALTNGMSLAECLKWGMAAGAATATTGGAEICKKPQVLALLEKSAVERR